MSKSVYSVVLQDEVVQALDDMAFQQGISRSALMNQILADAVSMVTTEQRMQHIFEALQQVLAPFPQFQLLDSASNSMCRVASALRYKYNPVVKYAVEFYPSQGGNQGVFRALVRSQSRDLLTRMHGFFTLWNALENETLQEAYPQGVACVIEVGKFHREFTFPKSTRLSSEQIGDSIAAYIRMFDGAMKTYFQADTQEQAQASAAEYYLSCAPKVFENCLF